MASCADLPSPPPPPPPLGADTIRDLFEAARPGARSATPSVEAILEGKRTLSQEDASWPTAAFLVGEIQLRRGDTARARGSFRDLATWAVSSPEGPYGDTWGGQGLALAGLWRWLQILDETGSGKADPGEVKQVLEVAEKLQTTRFYRAMTRSGLLPGLPQMAEEVAHRLAHVAWSNGRQDLAGSLYLDFLEIDSRGEADEIDREIQRRLLEEGLASKARLDLFRARRQLALVKTEAQKDEAARTLRKLWDDGQAAADVRAEAGYEWANYKRRQSDPARVALLNEVVTLAADGPVAAQALYRRAMQQRGDALVADMLELRRRFPESPLVDDALFEIANEYFFRPDLDGSLPYFKALQEAASPNDFQDSAYFLPAIGLLGRDRAGDLDAADKLLDKYLELYPEGPFRLRSLFWRGRIAERTNQTESARRFFRQVVEEAPYDYYGLRARMHLHEGREAIRQAVPAPSSRTWEELHQAFRQSRVDSGLTGGTPYHARLALAASSGIYERLLAAELETQTAFGKRLDDIPLSDLDARGATPAIALLLALRQDALAARDSAATADNRLRLGGLLGHGVGDWPAAIEVLFVPEREQVAQLGALQKEPRYPTTAYPAPGDLPRLAETIAGAAWVDEHGSKSLSQSLMYALIRQESRFYSGAISPVGAVGLFQMTPKTFAGLDKGGKRLEESGVGSDVEYLLDAQRNIATWADWFRADLARDPLPVAVMKHNAGAESVSAWTRSYWNKMGSREDLEYQVETVRFRQTRNFLRAVLQDTTMFYAAGYFKER